MGLQRVKIVSDNDSLLTRCFVGEHELHGVRGVDFRQTAGEFPQFNFDVYGLPDIDEFGDVYFSFTPETVQQAAIVLRNEFSNNLESREALVASIQSALQEETGLEDWNHAARVIADRIIGIEK